MRKTLVAEKLASLAHFNDFPVKRDSLAIVTLYTLCQMTTPLPCLLAMDIPDQLQFFIFLFRRAGSWDFPLTSKVICHSFVSFSFRREVVGGISDSTSTNCKSWRDRSFCRPSGDQLQVLVRDRWARVSCGPEFGDFPVKENRVWNNSRDRQLGSAFINV